MTNQRPTLLLLLLALSVAACGPRQTSETRDGFKTYYDHYNVQGSFVLYDQNNDKYVFYNRPQLKQPFIPASTFKILNSLIGLETGVIKDEDFVIPWDSVVRQNPNWNQNHSLKTAFKSSAVWYYQELARRVGEEQMKRWLDKTNYGNNDTSGGIDQFWLTGGLRISPEQQIDFLRRLRNNQLPFSQRTMDIVKNIMIAEDTSGYVIRAKTGWWTQDNNDIGWYVGYVESQGNVYYFANCIQAPDPDNNDFAKARIDIVYRILDNLGIREM